MTEASASRKGVSGDQKGPRMVLEVGERPSSVTILWLISSTSLSSGQLDSMLESKIGGTHDSIPRMSHTRHASFLFFW